MLRNSGIFYVLSLVLLMSSCGGKPAPFPAMTPVKRVELWVAAIRALDYPAYSELEVNPLEAAEFMSRYRLFYYDSVDLSPGVIDQKPTHDPVLRGNYRTATVSIRGIRVDRSSGEEKSLVMGSIKLVSRDRKAAAGPWKLHNRTLTELPAGGRP